MVLSEKRPKNELMPVDNAGNKLALVRNHFLDLLLIILDLIGKKSNVKVGGTDYVAHWTSIGD